MTTEPGQADNGEHSADVAYAKQFACLVAVADAAWRLARLSRRLADKLDLSERARSGSQLRYIERQIEEQLAFAGLRLVNLEGEPFDPGMAASALNAEEFNVADRLYVEQMVEPIVMGPDGLVRAGVVILGKASA